MTLSAQFLDEIRARTVLSALVGRRVKLVKAGREYKGCCPVHNEKTPSFYVNDEKGFTHCFGCNFHADAIGWLTQIEGMGFIEAVSELAAAAGMEMPARTPESAARDARIDGLRPALDAAQAIFAGNLEAAGGVREYLAGRGIGDAGIARFGIGYARAGGSLRGAGIGQSAALAAGLIKEGENGLREAFIDRVTFPIHDHRGRLTGFGARVWPGRAGQEPKYLNSGDSEIFDKGRILYNEHRAAERLRSPDANGARGKVSLIVCEGYTAAIALDGIGLAAVAPMGTALTMQQLERLWRLHRKPIVLFDGDDPGVKAALRAAETALPAIGPGRELAIASLPPGKDPDDLVRAGRAGAIHAALGFARDLSVLLFDEAARAPRDTPEARAAIWARLEALAGGIGDSETQQGYTILWRDRYTREIARPAEPKTYEFGYGDEDRPRGLPLTPGTKAEDGDYVWPDDDTESAKRLLSIVFAVAADIERRDEISAVIRDKLAMAKAIGFDPKAIRRTIADMRAEPDARAEFEASWALYRRIARVAGPIEEAILPDVRMAAARPVRITAASRRLAHLLALGGPAPAAAPDHVRGDG